MWRLNMYLCSFLKSIIYSVSLRFVQYDELHNSYGFLCCTLKKNNAFVKFSNINRIDRVNSSLNHDKKYGDVIKWKHFPRCWPFVRGIHRSPVNSPHKGQWRGALMFSLIWVWINDWVNNREAGDLRRYRAHYDVIVMWIHVQFECLLHFYLMEARCNHWLKKLLWLQWSEAIKQLIIFQPVILSRFIHHMKVWQ